MAAQTRMAAALHAGMASWGRVLLWPLSSNGCRFIVSSKIGFRFVSVKWRVVLSPLVRHSCFNLTSFHFCVILFLSTTCSNIQIFVTMKGGCNTIMVHGHPGKGHQQELVEHVFSVASVARALGARVGLAYQAELVALLHDLDLFLPDAVIDRVFAGQPGRWRASPGCGRRSGWPGAAVAHWLHGDPIVAQAVAAMRHALGPGERMKEVLDGQETARAARQWIDQLPEAIRPMLSGAHGPRWSPVGTVSELLAVRVLASIALDAEACVLDQSFESSQMAAREHEGGLESSPTRPVDLHGLVRMVERQSGAQAAWARRLLQGPLDGRGLFSVHVSCLTDDDLALLRVMLTKAWVTGAERVIVVTPSMERAEAVADHYTALFGGTGLSVVRAWIGEWSSLGYSDVTALQGPPGSSDFDREGAGLGVAASDGLGTQRRVRVSQAGSWAGQIVVTDHEDLAKILFSVAPASLRPLHRLGRSLLVLHDLDELATNRLSVTMAALSGLVRRYMSTVLLAYRVADGLSHLHHAVASREVFGWNGDDHHGDASDLWEARGWTPKRLTPVNAYEADSVKSCRITWPDSTGRADWDDLVRRVSGYRQVVCILHDASGARRLAQEIDARGTGSVCSLTAACCPAHRKEIVARCRKRVDLGAPCRLVADPVVEASALDFPNVLRQMASLGDIIRAFALCNQAGRWDRARLELFLPKVVGSDQDEERSGLLLDLLAAPRPDAVGLWNGALHREYVREAFSEEIVMRRAEAVQRVAASVASMDHRGLHDALFGSRPDRIRILVPWDRPEFDALVQEVRESGMTEDWRRRAEPFVVTMDRSASEHAIWKALESVPSSADWLNDEAGDESLGGPAWYLLTDPGAYHERFGLIS